MLRRGFKKIERVWALQIKAFAVESHICPRRWFENEIIRLDFRPIQHKHNKSQLFWSHVHLSVTIVMFIIRIIIHYIPSANQNGGVFQGSIGYFRSRPNLATLRGIPGIAASRNSAQLPGVQAQREKKFNTTEKKAHAVMLA